MKKGVAAAITDDEIRRYVNVPLSKAAQYLHTSPSTLSVILGRPNALGYAADMGPGKKRRYVIPAERLIKWLHGELMTDGNAVKINSALREYLADQKGLSYELV